MSRTTCKLCDGPLEHRLGTGGSGRSGEVTVELGPYLARQCEVAHFRYFPAPGFGGALRQALADALPSGTVCPGCGAGQSSSSAVRHDLVVDAPQGSAEARPVRVAVVAPARACACGVTWIDPATDVDVEEALVAALLGLRP